MFQHANATTSTQRGTVKRARAAVNVVLSSHHLTVTVAVLATLAILNVDLVNVTSMGPGGFTVNPVVDSAHANPTMLGSSATSVMMVTTASLNACVSYAFCIAQSSPHCGERFFYFCFQRIVKVIVSLSSIRSHDICCGYCKTESIIWKIFLNCSSFC